MGKDAFARAFERLLAIGKIELDAKLWQRENRQWKYGIRAVDDPAEKCTDRRCTDLAPTNSQPVENACTDPLAPTPLYTTYKTGAGPTDGPPPLNDNKGDRRDG